ncbi:META domain-containing protein [Jannaschia donghaensis]|uniref:META domain protein n=1 Tax=Jannaschia donghaensis TaxID=420998 RepID=A0A0M6YI82_9RHOB|nr:META domain-containing protein [Jannaschia donghaensis]CTQ50061.1 META domain protein [Jannaschia donghaensis]
MLCVLPFAFALGLCPDETVSGYVEPTTVWHLTEIDGAPYTADATITFPKEGSVRGTGPCNTFTATQSVPVPWIRIRDIASTSMTCPDGEAEAAYFAALQDMELIEVALDLLLLSTPDGRQMVFEAGDG